MTDYLLPPHILEAVVEDDDSGMLIVDSDNTILWCNAKARQFFGILDQELAKTSSLHLAVSVNGLSTAISAALSQGAITTLTGMGRDECKAVLKIKPLAVAEQNFCYIKITNEQREASEETELLMLKLQYQQALTVASHLFEQTGRIGYGMDGIQAWQRNLGKYSGDIVLCAHRPAGGVNLFVGDFIGGIIPAAVGALPLAEVFYGMTRKGFGLSDIVAELNKKLLAILPGELFCIGCFVEVMQEANILAVWNGGLPDLIVVDTDFNFKHRVHSSHLSLGLHKMKKEDLDVQFLEISPGDQGFVLTDGVLNAVNAEQQPFGLDAFTMMLMQGNGIEQIQHALLQYIDQTPQSDDMTLLSFDIDILLRDASDSSGDVPHQSLSAAEWCAEFEFSAGILRQIDLAPLLTNVVMQIQAPYEHRQRIYTILAELCTNALEHGLLKLDSSLKNSPKGFAEYYMLRGQRLVKLEQGFIKVSLSHQPEQAGGMLSISVEDSGEGFSYSQAFHALADNVDLSGRGLALLQRLCLEIYFSGKGNIAHATYYWET